GFRQILAQSAFPFVKIRNCVQPQSIYSEVQPEIQHTRNLLVNLRVVIVEIRLMGVEPMPIVTLTNRVPRPIRRLEIAKNDPGLLVPLGRVAPDIKLPPRASRFGSARLLKPRMLIGSMIDDQFGDDSKIPFVCPI